MGEIVDGRPEEAQYRAELRVNSNPFDSLYGAGLASEQSKPVKMATPFFYEQLLKVCSAAHSGRPEVEPAQVFEREIAGEGSATK